MLLERLPLDLQYLVLLDWISPEAVYAVAQTSDKIFESVKTAPRKFRTKCILSADCVDWFRKHNIPLQQQLDAIRLWYENGRMHREGYSFVNNSWYQSSRRQGYTNHLWYQHGRMLRYGRVQDWYVPPALMTAGRVQEDWYYQNNREDVVVLNDAILNRESVTAL